MIIKNNKEWIILAGGFCLFLAGNLLWWQKSSLPPHWDMTYHLNTSLNYLDLLRQGEIKNFLFQHYAYYPPLLYQLTAFLYFLFSLRIWIPHLVTTIFVLMAFLTTYGLGARIFDKKTGLSASFLLLFTPILYIFSRDYLVDIPLLALFMTSLLLLASSPFENSRKSILLGVLIPAGMLLKWSFSIFIFFPFLYFCIASLIFSTDRIKTAWNILMTVSLTLLFTLPWYYDNFSELYQDANINAFDKAAAENDPAVTSVQSIFYYASILINEYLYLPLACFVGIGIVQLIRKKEYVFSSILHGTVIFSYLIFTLIANKDPRYIMPLLPLFLLTAAYGLSSIKAKTKYILLSSILAIYLVLQFGASIVDLGFLSTRLAIPSLNRYLVSYEQRQPPLFFQTRKLYESPVIHEWVIYNPFSYFGQLPHSQNWYMQEIADNLTDQDTVMVAVDNDVYSNAELIYYFARVTGKNITLVDNIQTASFLVCQSGYCDPDITDPVPETDSTAGSNTYGPACQIFSLPDSKQIKACRLSLPIL